VASDYRIADCALIGDRRTAAVVASDGAVVWYCPERFDRPSLFAALLDPAAGAWTVEAGDARPLRRGYLGDSAILETRLGTPQGEVCVTDWMPVGDGAPAGAICRQVAPAPVGIRLVLAARPDYGRAPVRPARAGKAVHLGAGQAVHASHPLQIRKDVVVFELPPREAGWMVLGPADMGAPTPQALERWRETTRARWEALAARSPYEGLYRDTVRNSLRAIRLLCHEETGGIVAAATTSLPEIPGGARNWDYRYVWLRDAGMIASALLRLGGSLGEGEAYLGFICSSRGTSPDYPLPVLATPDGKAAPGEERLPLAGYLGSRPVLAGNGAGSQFQLDAFANVLLAAKLLYARTEDRPHWDTVAAVADFVAEHWHEPDHGIWEEPIRRQYTAGKVVAACGLDSIAEFAPRAAQAARWREAVGAIRRFVARHCRTKGGAYAVFAGSEAVDASAALFPVWAYTAADAPEMTATIAALERDCSPDGLLFRRHLECADARREGAFLAASLWVAQYWVMRGETERARRIIERVLACGNDLGLLAEEADMACGQPLGNFPQAFVHAALVGAVIDLAHAAPGGGPSVG